MPQGALLGRLMHLPGPTAAFSSPNPSLASAAANRAAERAARVRFSEEVEAVARGRSAVKAC